MVVMLPLWLPAYEERHGALPAEVQDKLHEIGAPTLDHLLAPYRLKTVKRRGGTKLAGCYGPRSRYVASLGTLTGPGTWRPIPSSMEERPRRTTLCEVLPIPNIFSGCTEQAAIWNKSAAQVLAQMQEIESKLPFALEGFDSDNGGEFLNYALWRYFRRRDRPVQFTRSRAYHKNDNAHVEQKNWTKVRQLLGYARYDQPELVALVQDLYRNEWRLLLNFFQLIMKLRKKKRHGSRVKKIHDRPQTLAQRLLAWVGLASEKRAWILRLQNTLKPLDLSKAVNKKVQRIRRLLREGVRHVA